MYSWRKYDQLNIDTSCFRGSKGSDIILQYPDPIILIFSGVDKPVDFTHHPDAEPESKSKNLLRFQENPLPNWGPKQKAKVMMNKNSSNGGTNEVEIIDKRARNQGKYSNNQKKKRQNICDEGDVIGENQHLAKKEKNDS